MASLRRRSGFAFLVVGVSIAQHIQTTTPYEHGISIHLGPSEEAIYVPFNASDDFLSIAERVVDEHGLNAGGGCVDKSCVKQRVVEKIRRVLREQWYGSWRPHYPPSMLEEKWVNLDGVATQGRWEQGRGGTIRAFASLALPASNSDARNEATADFFCSMYCSGAGQRDAVAGHLSEGAAKLGSLGFDFGLVELVVERHMDVNPIDVWGNFNDYGGDLPNRVAAVVNKNADFSAACAAPQYLDSNTVSRGTSSRVAVLVTGQFRFRHRDDWDHFSTQVVAGCDVFVCTYARHARHAQALTGGNMSRILFADDAVGAMSARSRALKNGRIQWLQLQLILDTFRNELIDFSVIVRLRTDLVGSFASSVAPLSMSKLLPPSTGIVVAHSDFFFFALAEVFLEVFSGLYASSSIPYEEQGYAYAFHGEEEGSARYVPLSWERLLSSDLSKMKWQWLHLPVHVFGPENRSTAMVKPSTVFELKSHVVTHLDSLNALEWGEPARQTANTQFERTVELRSFNSEWATLTHILQYAVVCSARGHLALATELSPQRFRANWHQAEEAFPHFPRRTTQPNLPERPVPSSEQGMVDNRRSKSSADSQPTKCAAPQYSSRSTSTGTGTTNTASRVALLITGEMRFRDANDMKRFVAHTVQGCEVFVATYASHAHLSLQLARGNASRVLIVDAAVTKMPVTSSVPGHLRQWLHLRLLLDAFGAELVRTSDIVARVRTDLIGGTHEHEANFHLTHLIAPLPGIVVANSDHFFYASPKTFIDVFLDLYSRAQTAHAADLQHGYRHAFGANNLHPRYIPINWQNLLLSDLSQLKWRHLHFPVELGPLPETVEELKRAVSENLEGLNEVAGGVTAQRVEVPPTELDRFSREVSSEVYFLVQILDRAVVCSVRGRSFAEATKSYSWHGAGEGADQRWNLTHPQMSATAAASLMRQVNHPEQIPGVHGGLDICLASNTLMLPRRCGTRSIDITINGSDYSLEWHETDDKHRCDVLARQFTDELSLSDGAGCVNDRACVAERLSEQMVQLTSSTPPPLTSFAPEKVEDIGWQLKTELEKEGFAVVKSAASERESLELLERLWAFVEEHSKARRRDAGSLCHLLRREKGDSGSILTTRHGERLVIEKSGILRTAAHSEAMWAARLLPRVRESFEAIWNTSELLVSFDTASIMFEGPCMPTIPGTGLHNDASWHRTELRGFKAAQGMLLLTPQNISTGGLVVVPRSHALHGLSEKRHGIVNGNAWLYPIPNDSPELSHLPRHVINAQAGDLILWDSRLAHGVVRPQRPPAIYETRQLRIAMYITMTPRRMASDEALDKRKCAFSQGLATGHWPHLFLGELRQDDDKAGACIPMAAQGGIEGVRGSGSGGGEAFPELSQHHRICALV